MYPIIDAHCHIYPDPIARKAVDSVEEFYPELPKEDLPDGTVRTLLDMGLAAGVSRFVVHSVATLPHHVRSVNRFIASSERASGGRFYGLGTLHPDSESVDADFDELLALGLHGVKLHPDIQKYRVDDPRIMRVFERCEALGLPVLVHTGDYRYDNSNPDRVANVLRAFPRLNFIGAHFGGWSVWEEAAAKLAGFENLTVDTCSSLFWLGRDRALALVDAYGCDRILFGTDYPMWRHGPEIERLSALGLTDDMNRRIFGENAARVFGISL